MAKPPAEPLFLARESYRRRRLGDAARIAPFVGLTLWLLAGLWSDTASAMIYIFAIWALLIVLVAFLSPRLIRSEAEADAAGETLPPPPSPAPGPQAER